jgi:hemoglobin-like flavoprotein
MLARSSSPASDAKLEPTAVGVRVTPNQKVLVQESFNGVLPIADTAADLFYARLFELDPSVRSLFQGDMQEQGRRLMQMLSATVRGLDHLDTLVPAVQALGRRHAGYGVRPEHFDTVGAALLWTLAQGLGSAFTSEVRDAWVAVYEVLAATMKSSIAEATRAAA